MHRLPSRIAAMMIGTIIVFALMVCISVVWMSRALDAQAREHSLAQIQNARANLLAQTRLLTLDYAKWDAALPSIAAADLSWVYENIGVSAAIGQAFQLVVVWGGSFRNDVGWLDDGVKEARAEILDPATIANIEGSLSQIPMNTYDGVEFFAWQGNSLYVVGASRIEADGASESKLLDAQTARIALGHRLTENAIAKLGTDYVLTGLEVVRTASRARSSLPLMGGDGRPVAYLVWDMPQPGTAMLRRMALPLLLTILLAGSLAALGMALTHRSAQRLIVAERQASSAARTDVLTGLPNRAAFNEVLAAPARACERAVLFLDVNDFKRINDSIGHEAGDQVILCVAQRMGRLISQDCFLARISGDEFVFVITGMDVERRTRERAELIQETLADPFVALGHHMQVGMSMGYAVQVTDDTTGQDLVRQADLAMYEAKRNKGQVGLVAFSAVIEQASRDAQVIEQGLRQALAQPGEFSIAYQPIVDGHGQMARAEALARWISPELGVVPPDRFVAVAERAGLIVELGKQLFRLICEDLVAHPDLQVSINISTLQLMAPDFIPSLVGELRSRRIDPTRIEIELTEAVVVDNSRLAAQRLSDLRAAGFSIALDDFGTGYSSVGYLEQFRFDTLKIDRSFVSKTRSSAKGVEVVDGMIRMARGLGLRVVCEGIETAEELELLRNLGSDLLQGYYLDRPLPILVLAKRWLLPTNLPVVAA